MTFNSLPFESYIDGSFSQKFDQNIFGSEEYRIISGLGRKVDNSSNLIFEPEVKADSSAPSTFLIMAINCALNHPYAEITFVSFTDH